MDHYVLVLVGEAGVETWWKSCQFWSAASVGEVRLNQGAGIVRFDVCCSSSRLQKEDVPAASVLETAICGHSEGLFRQRFAVNWG